MVLQLITLVSLKLEIYLSNTNEFRPSLIIMMLHAMGVGVSVVRRSIRSIHITVDNLFIVCCKSVDRMSVGNGHIV